MKINVVFNYDVYEVGGGGVGLGRGSITLGIGYILHIYFLSRLIMGGGGRLH